MIKRLSILLCALSCLSPAVSHAQDKVSGDLVIFHAGSLASPFQAISEEFLRQYPEVKILREAAGSRACARKISDLGRPCDVFASADYSVIDTLLIPKFASWNLRFARNEMAIVYAEKSRRAKDITAENWYEILLDKEVAFGRSDPNSDPCGYRAVLTMQLAEKFYKKTGLAQAFLSKDQNLIRPKETDLLALLEVGAIDYAFLYRSVAIQHKLPYVQLPKEVNLGDAALADLYKTVSVELTGEKPGATITQIGEPMAYGVTIPLNAPNRAAALAFVKFLLDKKGGLAVMEAQGQPSMVPSPCAAYDQLPEELKAYATAP